MANEPRFVFDTNVVIRALLLRYSAARQAFDRATQKGKFLISLATVEELNDVLQRKGFEKYITEEE
jgi:predicted nucleic acid-binding protein